MNTDLQLWSLIMQASLPVKAVMAILLLASFASWVVIFRKKFSLGRAHRQANDFEDRFWSGTDLNSLYNQVRHEGSEDSGMPGIFAAGFREFARMRQRHGVQPQVLVEAAERGMRIALNREIDRLESSLEFLATVGSTSPYIGLFGTVWGIMISFHALGNTAQATIAMVAPGISEALVATAMGLFAAIPAVVAYNRYATQVERLENRYETFKDEFSSLLQRQAFMSDAV